MIVESIMSRRVVVIHPDSTVRDAAALMRGEHVGSLLVTSAATADGIVTESDIVHRVVALGLDPNATRVRAIMSAPVASIHPTSTVDEASETMKRLRVKRLVVMLEGKIRGIVTARDIAYASPEAMRGLMEGWVKQRWQD